MNLVNDPDVEKIAKEILDNKEFREDCKSNIKNILKDGKVDSSDAPYILSMVVDILNEYPEINITPKKVEGVLRVVIMRLLEELSLINEDNRNEIEKLLSSALKLLVTTLKQKSLWSKLCKSCSCCNPKAKK